MAEPTRRVAFGTVSDADGHDTGYGHPERHARLIAVDQAVEAAQLGDALVRLAPRSATDAELTAVHDVRYLAQLEQYAREGGGQLDPDTVVSNESFRTAKLAAGLGLAAVDALRRGEADAAFVAPRPPGHHADGDRGTGFCLVNNVAVTAMNLANAGERVLIVDWDVHHGNGTQAIFWDDPRVMYVSTHQSPAYPGTGHPRETGGPHAPGTTLNAPLPPGATGDVARRALDDIVAESVAAFGPTWVLVSAGYDAHRNDPLADLMWTAGDYAALTRLVLDCAPQSGRTVCFLEGGYDLAALAASTAATLAVLAGAGIDTEPESSGGPGMAEVEWARRVRIDQRQAMA